MVSCCGVPIANFEVEAYDVERINRVIVTAALKAVPRYEDKGGKKLFSVVIWC
jgi:hypothetical protein